MFSSSKERELKFQLIFVHRSIQIRMDDESIPAGILHSIRMINFMKHDNLLFNFRPHVNFITGRNGSGKSSILTAISVGLGASSKIVGRGTNLGSLIKDGKREATIIITIKNTPNGYQELLFGSYIVVTRKIRQTSSSIDISNLPKNYKAKDVLNEILQYYSIQIDNPCCIMHQDTAREFLGTSSASKKYELFMRGTLLSRLKEEIATIKRNIEILQGKKEEKFEEKYEIQKQLNRKQVQFQIVQDSGEIAKTLRDLQDEMGWAQYHEKQTIADALEEEVLEIDKALSAQHEKVNEAQIEYEKAKESYEKTHQQMNEFFEMISIRKQQQSELSQQTIKVSTELSETKRKLKRLQNIIESKTAQIANERKEIESLKTKMKFEEDQKKKGVIAELEDQLESVQTELNDIETKINEIRAEIRTKKRYIEEAQSFIGSNKHRITEINQELKELRSVSNDHSHNSIQWRIKQNQDKFGWLPIGPIKHYIKLKHKKWGIAAQNIFHRVLNAFIVNSHEDEITLSNLNRDPLTIIKSNFLNNCQPITIPNMPPGAISAIDALVIDQTEVRSGSHSIPIKRIITNVFLDILNADKILIFDDAKQAKQEAYARHITAYALDGFSYKVQSGYQMRVGSKFNKSEIGVDDSLHINELEREKMIKQEEIETKSSQIEDTKRDLSNLKYTNSTMQAQRTALSKKANELDDLIRNPQDDDNNYQPQIEVKEEKILLLEREIPLHQEEQTKIEDKIRELKDQKAQKKAIVDNLTADLDKTTELQSKHDIKLNAYNNKKQEYEKLKFKEANLNEAYQKKCQEKDQAVSVAKDYYNKAMQLNPDVDMQFRNHTRSTATLTALLRETTSQYEEIQRSKNLNFNEVQKEYFRLKAQTEQADKFLLELQEFIHQLNESLVKRQQTMERIQHSLTRRAKVSFNHFLSKRKYNGKLIFDHENNEINIGVKSKNDDVYTYASDLSGGEKSFSLVSLLLSLWEIMDAPFLAIDEFDVFMDEINREAALQLLIKGTSVMSNKQFIFITPLSLNTLKQSEQIAIFEVES